MKRILPLVLVASTLSFPAWMAAGECKEDFSSGKVPSGWPAAKGEWTVVDGALKGKELPADKHAAVLTLPDSHANSTISLRFQNTGAKGFHLSYNHPKGHLFRIKAADGKVDLVLDKDKKDPSSKTVVLASGEFAMEDGKWYDMTCKVDGDTVEATVGGVTLKGSHPNLTKEKTGYRFVVQGDGIVIDDIAYSSSK